MKDHSDRQYGQDGYKPMTEGYQPLRRGYQTFPQNGANDSVPPQALPLGRTSAMPSTPAKPATEKR